MDLRASFSEIDVSPEERNHRHNMEQYANAGLRMQHEALQKNLTIIFMTMVVAFIAVLVSIVIGILVLVSRPDVTVKAVRPDSSQEWFN